mgnify:CR=1 FL=1
MKHAITQTTPLPQHALWDRAAQNRVPLSFTLEVTARCNLNCRHCYINLPAHDARARRTELTLQEIDALSSQAVEMGALWCLVTGGEPLLRQDFPDIYRLLKRKGLLVSVFTNACLVTPEHVRLFQEFPPRDLEVTVYGITPQTFSLVTRKPSAYPAFRQGLQRLIEGNIPVHLKTMALKSNLAEQPEIAKFCREVSPDAYRFDPLLHMRLDGNPQRNAEIRSERLTPQEIVTLEQADPPRQSALKKSCTADLAAGDERAASNFLIECGAGKNSFVIGYDSMFRLCEALVHTDFTYDLRQGSLKDAWQNFAPKIRILPAPKDKAQNGCWRCALSNLCLWCPAHALLEIGQAQGPVPYFCETAHARAEALRR